MKQMILKAIRIAAIAGGVFAAAVIVRAHAKLEKTEPAANATVASVPNHVQLFFNETPDLAVSKLEIKGPSDKVKLVNTHVMGKSLMAMVEGEMTDGVYTVLWTTAGDDGHPQKGEFKFTLKRK
jgi:methionine-rich copper-binding protein CopC